MPDGLGPDFDHSIPQAGQRPVCYCVWQHQCPQEVGQIVSQCMKLEADLIGLEGLARQPCPFEGVLAFLDVLLCRSSPVVEFEYPFFRYPQRGDNKANPWEQLSRMPFHLGHHPARFAPAVGLIGEVGIMALNLVGWTPRPALEEIGNSPLQHLVGPQPDGIAKLIDFQIIQQFGNSESGIGTQIFAPQARVHPLIDESIVK